MQSILDDLAMLIDTAADNGDAKALDGALNKLNSFNDNDLSKKQLSEKYFYIANCYSSKVVISGQDSDWKWKNLNLEKEIYYLRLSLLECNSQPIVSDLKFRIQTNLANALNHIGRFVEAIEIWDQVLIDFPDYAMAIGNRGHCLSWYARYLADVGHQPIFFNESYNEIKRALKLGVEEHAKIGMLQWLEKLEAIAGWDEFEFVPKNESRGRSKLERSYRTWCIDNRLFLNPLNDLWGKDIVANDVLTFPSTITISGERSSSIPEVYGIYNQLKQEYASARFILFEAINDSNSKLHFSDKRIKLYDMLDYRNYGLWIEKIKMAFLSSYAIFDKIAYLINTYWKLNIDTQRIKFNTIWFKSSNPRKNILDDLNLSENWPLNGLFWLSKDLYFKKTSDHVIEPDARHLNHIRNHIAHKYLKIYDDNLVDTKMWRENTGFDLSYPISGVELKNQAMRLIKLVRSSLIYVSLAAHEEENKIREKINDGMLAEIELYEIDDRFRY